MFDTSKTTGSLSIPLVFFAPWLPGDPVDRIHQETNERVTQDQDQVPPISKTTGSDNAPSTFTGICGLLGHSAKRILSIEKVKTTIKDRGANLNHSSDIP